VAVRASQIDRGYGRDEPNQITAPGDGLVSTHIFNRDSGQKLMLKGLSGGRLDGSSRKMNCAPGRDDEGDVPGKLFALLGPQRGGGLFVRTTNDPIQSQSRDRPPLRGSEPKRWAWTVAINRPPPTGFTHMTRKPTYLARRMTSPRPAHSERENGETRMWASRTGVYKKRSRSEERLREFV